MAMDEEFIPHPYANYNKKGDVTSLVGNWFEERALKEATGISRLPGQLHDNPSTIYATRHDTAVADMATAPRVLDHQDQTAPQDWNSMYQRSYEDTKSASKLLDYADTRTLGPRAQRELEALKAEAAREQEELERSLAASSAPPPPSTTHRDHFVSKDLSVNSVGSRVMEPRYGVAPARDATFLAETQLMPRTVADRVLGEAAQRAGATDTTVLPDPEVPITIYSEAAATQKYNGTFNGTRPTQHTRPFNKFSNFTKPLSDYSKVVEDE